MSIFPQVSPHDLSHARRQLHEAAQIVAGIGISFVTKQDDDSHTNMEWLPGIQAFAGHPFNNGNLRVALQTATLSILLLNGDNDILETYALNGHTQDEAVAALKAILKKHGFDATAMTMDKHYEIPETDQGRGAAYQMFNKDAFTALTTHFNYAQMELERVVALNPGASDIRLWPHHFDVGLLLPLGGADSAKTISMGFSPGDVHYDTPYYYVSPWPYPEKESLKKDEIKAGGYWHTGDFIAAVLLAKAYSEQDEPAETISAFMDSAVAACRKHLGL